ncbi:MAG: hypothetical protein ACLRX3_07915 [Subdoligranulum sp.]
MLIPVLLFIVGLLCLIKGGDWFVDGATGIARRFHVPELLIGATVVSIGTTLPEVMVSTTSALTGHGEIAYGNAIGSVICNAALIAAITIAVRPGKVDPKSLRTPVAFFFVARRFLCRCGLHHRLLHSPGGPDPAGHVRGLHRVQRAGYEKYPRPGRGRAG